MVRKSFLVDDARGHQSFPAATIPASFCTFRFHPNAPDLGEPRFLSVARLELDPDGFVVGRGNDRLQRITPPVSGLNLPLGNSGLAAAGMGGTGVSAQCLFKALAGPDQSLFGE